MTTFTHQLLSRKTSTPEVWQCECEYSSHSRPTTVSVAVLRTGYAEVVFIQPGRKLDTMWRGAWQRLKLATRHQGKMWPLQMVTAAGRCSLSQRQKHRNLQRESSLSQTFCPPNSPDLNTVNLPSGVLFSRRSTIIEVSPLLTQWKNRMQRPRVAMAETTAWRSHCHSSLLSPFYLRLMLFADGATIFRGWFN